MERVKLDRVDLSILGDLQEQGRMTNVELAKRAGITPPPCLRRVRALEQAGFIRGFHAELNHEALGFAVTVFAHVGFVFSAGSPLVTRHLSLFLTSARRQFFKKNFQPCELRRLRARSAQQLVELMEYFRFP